MPAQLKYLSDKAMSELKANTETNLDRYRTEGFADLANDPGWNISLGVEYDDELLQTLDTSTPPRGLAAIDKTNSLIVGKSLASLSPTHANEERVWIRLCHIEAFAYAKARWIDIKGENETTKQVENHLFATGQTRIRDDNAISRLWWNYHIARTCDPDNPEQALDLILKTADIRSNFVERIWMTSRKSIASAVLRLMKHELWITEAEVNFREFMKSLNRFGGGIVFEVLESADIDKFLKDCVKHARSAQ